jgi:hypothetical protein
MLSQQPNHQLGPFNIPRVHDRLFGSSVRHHIDDVAGHCLATGLIAKIAIQ